MFYYFSGDCNKLACTKPENIMLDNSKKIDTKVEVVGAANKVKYTLIVICHKTFGKL